MMIEFDLNGRKIELDESAFDDLLDSRP